MIRLITPDKKTYSGSPTIRIAKSGGIDFSKVVCEKIGLTHQSKVSFFQDDENPSDWYLYTGSSGVLNVRLKRSGKLTALCTTCRSITKKILETANIKEEDRSIRAMLLDGPITIKTNIGEQKLWPLGVSKK